jgi:hypothetical protein
LDHPPSDAYEHQIVGTLSHSQHRHKELLEYVFSYDLESEGQYPSGSLEATMAEFGNNERYRWKRRLWEAYNGIYLLTSEVVTSCEPDRAIIARKSLRGILVQVLMCPVSDIDAQHSDMACNSPMYRELYYSLAAAFREDERV